MPSAGFLLDRLSPLLRAGTRHTGTRDKTTREKPATDQKSPSTDMKMQRLKGRGNGARCKRLLLSGKKKNCSTSKGRIRTNFGKVSYRQKKGSYQET